MKSGENVIGTHQHNMAFARIMAGEIWDDMGWLGLYGVLLADMGSVFSHDTHRISLWPETGLGIFARCSKAQVWLLYHLSKCVCDIQPIPPQILYSMK
jgi:hypothetical protein